jgi:thiamine-monophosphate kinase
MTPPNKEAPIIGKSKLSNHLVANFNLHKKSSIKGISEDAAVIDNDTAHSLAASTLLVEGVHFDLTYCPLQHIGYKAIVVGVADILAMNGLPERIILKVSVSNQFTLRALKALYEGAHIACQFYGLDLVGHELIPGAMGLAISATVLGKVNPSKVCSREGAKPYDIVCVTGDLGAAYLGLQILIREKKVFEADPTMQPELAPYQYLIQRQLKPTPRLDIIQSLEDLQIIPSSMINVKDGLASALLHIGKQSSVGMAIYEDKLPLDQQTYEVAEMLQLAPAICALHGGEDYELLFTVSQAMWSRLENNPLVHPIGYVIEASHGIKLAASGNTWIDITAQDWEEVEEQA